MAEKETLTWSEFWERRQEFIADSLRIANKYGIKIDIHSRAYPLFASKLEETFRREVDKHYLLNDC